MTISSQPLETQLTVFEKNRLGVIIHLKNSETISINGAFSFQINELTLSIKKDKDVWLIDIEDISYIHSRLLSES